MKFLNPMLEKTSNQYLIVLYMCGFFGMYKWDINIMCLF